MTSYNLTLSNNKQKYETLLTESILEYEKYFNSKLKYSPCIIFLKSRREFNDICGRITESWVTGSNIQNLIFMMEESVYEKESSKKFDPKNYPLTIRHELCHIFYNQLARKSQPLWLNEGLALYLSGQIKLRLKPEKFSEFLLFDEKNSIGDKTVYKEAGFVIEKLVSKFGKEKLLKLITSCRQVNDNNEFLKLFKTIYGFELSYNNINKL